MLALLFQPDAPGVSEAAIKAAVEAALKSSDKILDQGVLGACLILSLLGNIALVWLVVRVQNLRVKDYMEVSKVAQDMVTTFAAVDRTLKDLNDSSKTQNSALQGVTTTLNTMMMSMLARVGIGHNNTLPPSGGHTP